MTTLQRRPVCAAVLIMLAHAARAQTTDAAPAVNPDGTAPPIQQVTVTGLRSSIKSAEAIKRNAPQVVDSINAEDIGKFPDRAAGDALQRIAGVQCAAHGYRSLGMARRETADDGADLGSTACAGLMSRR